MPLRASIACLLLLALGASAALRADASALVGTAGSAAAAVPDDEAVQKAIAALRSDPQMGGTQREQKLHWRERKSEAPGKVQPWLRRLLDWFIAAAQWVTRSARALVIVAAALGAALLAVVILRALRGGSRIETPAGAPPPTHVRGLDIRPEELPQDVSRAARNLWERGERRGAMILLYRAVLSRLVHRYNAAIRDSSTEGDCLRLAAGALAAAPLDYVARFVGCWQRAMYAASWPGAADFETLCAGFEAALPAPVESAAASSPHETGA